MVVPADPLSSEELLAQRHFIAGLARRLVGDAAFEDVAQETYVRLLGDANVRPRSVRAWLRTVVANVVRQVGRGERRRIAREQTVALPAHASAPAAADLA